ncbi:MAG: RNA polymerase factor sigma-54 [Myxococcales bacterium]|nr:RNA polymerase factor sigma-54 [Myxococcales bacterium]MDD9972238.1 RNA polymerase factor sigma-54 [Myxococcales bacterium]
MTQPGIARARRKGQGKRLELKQQLKMSQQLVMTPQLQQAIKLLQMSRMELVETVHQELLENPVLEDQREIGQEAGAGSEPAANGESSDGANGAAMTSTIDQAVARDDRQSEQSTRDADKKASEIDWDRYIENHAMQAPMPGGGINRGSGDELPGLEATLSRGEDLVDHLEWQVLMSDMVEDERRFAALVLGNLDDRAYLTVDGLDPQEIVPKLAEEAGLNVEDAEEVLSLIQHFDPIGVAARSLRECLLIQARHHGLDDLSLRVIDEFLPELERRAYQVIARALGVEVEEIYDIAQVIAELEPRPARNFLTAEPQYIVPDVSVHKVGDKYFVVANDDGMPKLKISGFYRSAMKGNAEAKEYIQNKLRSAQWLIRSIDQRRKTIERVTECIVDKQRDFFDKGIQHLRPMILRDVAEEIGMHESTISRVTSNKYVATPRGVFELKYFFNSAIKRSSSTEDIASESVKQAIKKLIDAEEPARPYSDQKLVELLRAQNIVIARRTVAKYREMLGILSSSKRKKYF